jgi:hypothetical protein
MWNSRIEGRRVGKGRRIWQTWKRLAHRIGVLNSYLLLTLFYLILIGPVSVLARLFGMDWLGESPADRNQSTWIAKESREQTLAEYEKPY